MKLKTNKDTKKAKQEYHASLECVFATETFIHLTILGEHLLQAATI